MPSNTHHPSDRTTGERIIKRQRPFTAKYKGKFTTNLRNRLSHNSTKRELQITKSTLKLQSVYTEKLESLLQTHRETQETDRNYIQILENLTQTKDDIIEAKAEQIDICQEQILTLQRALVDKSKDFHTPNLGENKELKSYRKYTKSLEKAIAQSGKLIDYLQRQINPAESTSVTPSSPSIQSSSFLQQPAQDSPLHHLPSQSPSFLQQPPQDSISLHLPSQSPSFLQQPPQDSNSHHPSSQSPSRDSPKDGKLEDGESVVDELEDGEVP